LINIVPLLEAKDSSKIENIVTTTDRLFQYAEQAENSADPATKDVLRYRQALFQGYLSLNKKPLCIATAVEVCTTIKGVDIEIRRIPGIALENENSGKLIYTPPEGEQLIQHLMANWEQFIHNHTDIEPLVRMAISHYQFEAIHPFIDGNGRTGRIINLLFLIEQGLLDSPVLYLSRYIVQNKSDYYRYLQEVTNEDAWDQWVLYILDAVEKTSIWTREKLFIHPKLMTLLSLDENDFENYRQ